MRAENSEQYGDITDYSPTSLVREAGEEEMKGQNIGVYFHGVISHSPQRRLLLVNYLLFVLMCLSVSYSIYTYSPIAIEWHLPEARKSRLSLRIHEGSRIDVQRKLREPHVGGDRGSARGKV